MPNTPGLTSQNYSFTNNCTSRNPYLSNNCSILSDNHIMSNMNKIIYFYTFPYPGWLQVTPVNSSARTYFNPIFNNYITETRDPDICSPVTGIPKSITANHDTRLNDNIVSY